MRHHLRTLGYALTAALATLLLLVGPAQAHIHVSPEKATAGDASRFTFEVPNEADTATVKVVIALPEGVVPSSYADAPGWVRTLQQGESGAPSTITWTGRLAPEKAVVFSFRAATPPLSGDLVWKVLQYHAGEMDPVRWVGAPDSDYPAPVTTLTGGPAHTDPGHTTAEHGSAEGHEHSASAFPEIPYASALAPAAAQSDPENDNNIALWVVGGGALVLGGLALGLAVVRRRTVR